jgi:8-hydroxy-5-deazaflavin:NADPH oxidoreductase
MIVSIHNDFTQFRVIHLESNMKIAILGTGMVGQTLASALVAKGHEVVIGTRDVQKSLSNMAPHPFGMPGFGVWKQSFPSIAVKTFADAMAGANLFINATNGKAMVDILANVPQANYDGKVMIDAANALDFSKGMPPRVGINDAAGASIGEQIQNTYPALKVVKALNTITAYAMLNPKAVAGDSTLFMCGNDANAKATVLALLESFGWRDVIDLGDISNSCATELMMPIWLRVWSKLGQTTVFNYKIVR